MYSYTCPTGVVVLLKYLLRAEAGKARVAEVTAGERRILLQTRAETFDRIVVPVVQKYHKHCGLLTTLPFIVLEQGMFKFTHGVQGGCAWSCNCDEVSGVIIRKMIHMISVDVTRLSQECVKGEYILQIVIHEELPPRPVEAGVFG